MSWSIRGCESKGRLFAKNLPSPTGVQELREEHQLPRRSHWSVVISLHMIAPSALYQQGRQMRLR